MNLFQKGWSGLNSTMVRLKRTRGINIRPEQVLSQFHYGSIKTP
ncbi:Hypothetical protein IALB_1222 [Ignavibacterium album JCM 16511]|uniref:Uncharacterized protein n=1 Tax=Ignavibacterium album (strain DSM 19864 / JCM 16511 / NBRC 101810 / Mat9-16) TaxID=945713 RepID=I0AIX6_IGNAJ|nr:Hypothetical protein IALB_1222 [Ignavibacterium album JCM 16511]